MASQSIGLHRHGTLTQRHGRFIRDLAPEESSLYGPDQPFRKSSGSLAMFTADSCKWTAPGSLTCWGWMPGAALDLVRTKRAAKTLR